MFLPFSFIVAFAYIPRFIHNKRYIIAKTPQAQTQQSLRGLIAKPANITTLGNVINIYLKT